MIYRSHYVLTMVGEPIIDGEVLVRGGRIEAVGSDLSSTLPAEPTEDLGHAVILPGIVNAHTHLDYTIFRGVAENQPFLPWIRTLTDVGKKLEYDDFLASARLGALQLVRSGVTTIADSSISGAVIEAAREAGLRGIVYQETFGPDPNGDFKDQIIRLAECISELSEKAGERLTVGVSPHSVYTSSERLLKLVTKLAREQNLAIALHASESKDEVALIESAEGHIADIYRLFQFNFVPRSITPIAYLQDIGLLGPKTLLAHCVHVTDKDLDTIAKEHTSVVHCPKSNAKLAVGVSPLDKIVGRGITTGIGTDSAASDDAMDMFEEMRFAILAQRMMRGSVEAMDAARVLELATLGGAEALGLASEIGSIEPGKQADIVAVDLATPAAFGSNAPVSAVVYGCSASDVILTMVAGEVIYRRGEYRRVDADDIRQEAALAACKL